MSKRDLLLLSLATLACLLPFIAKAVHLDDPVYVWIAQQITVDPLDFFGFKLNWHGGEVFISQFNRNPPGVSYLLALAGWLAGWSEVSLHLAILPCALAVVLGTYTLARRACDAPLLATAIGCATPAFVVSATTLMADIPMLAYWIWAVVFWERGMRTGARTNFFFASLLISLAALTKFIAVALIPLLLCWSLARELRVKLHLLWLVVPIATLFAFDSYTVAVYGNGILSDAAGYAAGISTTFPLHERVLTAFIFVGGTLLTTALYFPWLASGRLRLAFLLAAPVLLAILIGNGKLGFTPVRWPEAGVRWDLALHACVFATASLPLLALSAIEMRHWRRDGFAWLFGSWILGVFVFAAAVNWTVSTRVILPMVPAAGIVIVRGLERAGTLPTVWRVGPLLVGLAISLLVAQADYQWAASARDAAIDLSQRYESKPDADYVSGPHNTIRFQGHWGFQYYMEQAGAEAFDLRKKRVTPGAILINPCNNTNVVPLSQAFARFIETVHYPTSRYLTVHSPARGVGFYASTFGPLPYALGAAPSAPYDVLRMQAPTGAPAEGVARSCGVPPTG